jgi:hypothetical protein
LGGGEIGELKEQLRGNVETLAEALDVLLIEFPLPLPVISHRETVS